MLRIRNLGVGVALAALTALPAARQEPKPGNTWYEDKVDLGFKVKAPKDWDFVPGSPLERNLIGKYADPGEGKYVSLGNDAEIIAEILLVKFDRRGGEKKEKRQVGDQTVELSTKGLENVGKWMELGLDEGAGWHKVEGPTPLKNALPEATFSIYEGTSTRRNASGAEPQPVRAFVASFPLSAELDVALIGLGPAGKKWRPFESAYTTIAKTLQPVKLEGTSGASSTDAGDPRSEKRAKLQADIAKNPGWSLYETPNYFIVSCYDDKQFIEEMKLRLEGIRQVYERDYPPSIARKIRPRELADGDQKKAGAPEAAQDPDQTVAKKVAIDALELGKNSVVRLCKDRGQYLQYGGREKTSGYFSSMEGELVIFDDKQDQGRDHTWGVMNHEGFHQYIHAFFGNISPHSWYNEGTGDYYSGFEFNLKTKKFTPKKEIGRQDNLLRIRDNYVPLREFVTWTKVQYYGRNSGGIKGDGKALEGWALYAQGWSMIWFLRTGAGKAKGWQASWGTILDVYLDTLLETADLAQAVKKAFEGVDWDAFEKSWNDYSM